VLIASRLSTRARNPVVARTRGSHNACSGRRQARFCLGKLTVGYYFDLALRSLQRNKLLIALMVRAIASPIAMSRAQPLRRGQRPGTSTNRMRNLDPKAMVMRSVSRISPSLSALVKGCRERLPPLAARSQVRSS